MEKPKFDESEKTPTQATFDKSVKADGDPYASLSKDDKKRAMQEAIARKIAQNKKDDDEKHRRRSEKFVRGLLTMKKWLRKHTN